MRTLAILLAMITIASASTLETYKATYKSSTDKYRAEYDAVTNKLNWAYGFDLKVAVDVLRIKGDPDILITAMKEKARFEKEGTVPEPTGPQEVKDAIEKYNKGIRLAQAQNVQKNIALTTKYIRALDGLMRRHTSKSELDEAMDAKIERNRAMFISAHLSLVLKKVGIVSTKPRPPKDAVKWNGHYYKNFPEKMTWNEAKAKCEKMGGHLASIASAKENTFLISLVGGRGRWWLGATDEKVQNRWEWVDGTPWGYSDWWPVARRPHTVWDARPRRGAGNHLILAFRVTGSWDNIPGGEVGFICEWE